ncbi:F0F1 ATP synthase subunit alpha, partial [Candidatus Saccharibacteria bacterium]|nr:F0F1 ATP synthase subunit alpha [Candidatus Saccharibacteria bacterium]
RVGSSAQTKAIKNVAGQLRLDLAQYRDLAAFAQLASDLDAQTKAKLDRGQRIVEMLKQPQYQPYSLAHQVILIWVATNGFLDDITLDQVADFNQKLISYLDQKYLKLVDKIEASDMKGEEVNQLKEAVERFKREEMGGN